MDHFDKTLTQEERSAPTFIEWSDATLACGVRTMAANLHDSVGFNGITGMAAALALEKIARDSNSRTYRITINGGTRITVRLQNATADQTAVAGMVRRDCSASTLAERLHAYHKDKHFPEEWTDRDGNPRLSCVCGFDPWPCPHFQQNAPADRPAKAGERGDS